MENKGIFYHHGIKGMKWDDLAKSNEAIIDDLRKEVSKYGR